MKKATQIVKLTLATLLFTATAPMLQAAPRHTGIQGQAALYISYGTPTLFEAEPGLWLGITVGDIMTPVATSFSVLSAHSGRELGHFSTEADGAFTVSLPPGRYVVVPDDLTVSGFPFAQSISTGSFEVTVRAKNFTYALILYYNDGPFGIISEAGD